LTFVAALLHVAGCAPTYSSVCQMIDAREAASVLGSASVSQLPPHPWQCAWALGGGGEEARTILWVTIGAAPSSPEFTLRPHEEPLPGLAIPSAWMPTSYLRIVSGGRTISVDWTPWDALGGPEREARVLPAFANTLIERVPRLVEQALTSPLAPFPP
jgi:hypothetical protein